MTNYEHIKQMSVEGIAEFICGIHDEYEDNAKFINGITIPEYDEYSIKEWLESEAEGW